MYDDFKLKKTLWSPCMVYTKYFIAVRVHLANEPCLLFPQGQFCEQCASGFKRAVVNGGAYGVCVPCSCNSHQESLAACEPETGACNCTHNTTGLQCELCMPGFYGDATLGTTGIVIKKRV